MRGRSKCIDSSSGKRIVATLERVVFVESGH